MDALQARMNHPSRAEARRQEALDLLKRIRGEPRFRWETMEEFLDSVEEQAGNPEARISYRQVNALWRIWEHLADGR